jgi:RHS repeat-associated protein
LDYYDYGNGVRNDLDYDGRGFTKLINSFRLSPSQPYTRRDYWRDSRDRITTWKKAETGRGDRYSCDAEGQLTNASYQALTPETNPTSPLRSDIFTYDALGNRQSWNYLASRGWMNFTRRDNRLNQYGSWENNIPAGTSGHWGSAIYHDDNSPWAPWNVFPGNGVTMADGWLVASYNALNQPVAMIPYGSANVFYFGYDPLGRCVKRWEGSSGTATTNPATYLYYDGWSLVQEGSSASSAGRLYVHGGRVDEIVASQKDGVWNYHHYDARGHCILLTGPSGNVIEQYEYDAFGKPYFYNAIGVALPYGSSYGNRFLFTGREWLKDLKLYDYRARMYQPELGRFLQPDPKQFAAGDHNLYRYCHNDPINRVDPTGLRSEVAVEIYKQKLVPVLGSNIRQWITTLAIHFTLSGNFSDPNPLNHVVASLRANGADAKGRTDSDMKVRDVGAKGLNANLNINYWIVNTRYDSLERQHTWGAEGSRTKGLLEAGGYLSRMQERWKEGIGAPFGRDIASWWLEGGLRAQLQMARSEQRDTWDINGDHNR